MRTLAAVIFPGFELLDLFGPLEMFGMFPGEFRISLTAETERPVASAQGPRSVVDRSLARCGPIDILLVPGGPGTRAQVDNPRLVRWLGERAADADRVLSVCTGSALLARSGVLDGRKATTNKAAFDWVAGQRPAVHWQRRARWVEHDRFVTSSGVSAGIDMSLAVIADLLGKDQADEAARAAEYQWRSDPADDPFAASPRP